jgi:hypothetical protein
MTRTEKYKNKLKGEAYWLSIAIVKELMFVYFLIVELAHLLLPHPTDFACRVVVLARDSKTKIQTAKQYKKSAHPP